MTGMEPMFDFTDRASAALPADAQAGPAPTTPPPAGPATPTARTGTREGKPAADPGPRVIGLDLSLAATGIADARDGQIHTGTIRTGTYGPGLDERMRRIWYITREIWRIIDAPHGAPALIVIEGPSYNSQGGQAHERAGLWWHVVHTFLTDCQPVAVVPPAALKKYATGKGTATKPDMRMALFKRAGLDLRDDGQVDAWWLAAIGLDHLRWTPFPVPQTHRQALDKVAWPKAST
ncbi:RuvC family protein [Thermomonospora amylolytica]|uniref:Holliday junction endonuclease n=1 Tax=Thermomonospora amylolytica TaxID=1411117 RepID=UPI001300A218|nr:Holliday junction endonuclease [Thermomonospora amylolytica]